jgi:hypothetical protein
MRHTKIGLVSVLSALLLVASTAGGAAAASYVGTASGQYDLEISQSGGPNGEFLEFRFASLRLTGTISAGGRTFVGSAALSNFVAVVSDHCTHVADLSPDFTCQGDAVYSADALSGSGPRGSIAGPCTWIAGGSYTQLGVYAIMVAQLVCSVSIAGSAPQPTRLTITLAAGVGPPPNLAVGTYTR